MKISTHTATALAVASATISSANAFSVEKKPRGVNVDLNVGGTLKNAAAASFAALTIASNIGVADASTLNLDLNNGHPGSASMFEQQSSILVSEAVTREGMYGTYEVDVVQEYDDARSTFKPAKETKSKKGKYTALLAILVVGSFIIPMAQYFWYVKDDDSSDRFFNQEPTPPPPPEPKKKKGWF